MATAAQPSAIDEAGKWFWNFLKTELTPYPGRAWVVGRVTISATIVMILVMTFRLPGGFLGAIFTIFLSRENPTATFRAGFRTVAAFLIATAYTAFGVMILIDDPMTHFLWVAFSLFLSFYLLRIVADYGTGVAFGFMVTGAISLWD
jgi:multidrug resistance protein MdtO